MTMDRTPQSRSRRLVTAVAIVTLTAGLAGCDLLLDARDCPTIVLPAVSVRIEDSVTGAPAAAGARLVVRDGSYADSSSIPEGQADRDAEPIMAALERAGTYVVTVSKAGYRDWTRSGVRVAKDECNVRTANLTARLQRS
jgi:hypothetical protein